MRVENKLSSISLFQQQLTTDRLQMIFGLPAAGGRSFPGIGYPHPLSARKDDAPAAVQAADANLAGLGSTSGCGGLIQTTSG